jgi:hypothetical protein
MSKYDRIEPMTVILGMLFLGSVFIVGGLFALRQYPPFNFLEQGFKNTAALYEQLFQTQSPLLQEHVYEGDGVTKHDLSQTSDGLTVMQGIFSGGLQVRLIDMEGTELHSWPLDFFRIWPDPTHLTEQKRPKTPYDHHSQGMLVLPDGSIIVNFGYLGTAKLDKCGDVLWTVDRMTRHFVSPDGNGNYWIGANREIDNISDDLLLFGINRDWLKATYQRYENTMLRVSSEGEVLEEVSVLQMFYDAGLEGSLYDSLLIAPDDPTHHNNIEIVTEALADKIDAVNAGDMLLSIRNMHMLVIVDRDTYAIKWKYSGGFTRQHDPDITPEGNIIVFNNSQKAYGFNRVKGSSLTELDPATDQIRIVHPQEGQPGFYSRIFGTHQALSNGNIFVSEGLAGRVFEINSKGDIVWEYVSRYDDAHASVVEDAYRFDQDYFTVGDWNCPAAN